MERHLRYRQKIDFIIDKIGDIPNNVDSSLAIDATLYRVQTSIDALMDIIAMLVKDKGKSVSDDYGNINILLKIKVFNKKLADDLIMLNGLRNAIVHKYNTFEEDTVIKNIGEIKLIIQNFLEIIENEIKTIFKSNKK